MPRKIRFRREARGRVHEPANEPADIELWHRGKKQHGGDLQQDSRMKLIYADGKCISSPSATAAGRRNATRFSDIGRACDRSIRKMQSTHSLSPTRCFFLSRPWLYSFAFSRKIEERVELTLPAIGRIRELRARKTIAKQIERTDRHGGNLIPDPDKIFTLKNRKRTRRCR